MISFSIFPRDITYRPHLSLMPQDISNASFAISKVISARLSSVIIHLGLSRTWYFTHFLFRSAQNAPKAQANFSLYSSSCWIVTLAVGKSAISVIICDTFPTTTP